MRNDDFSRKFEVGMSRYDDLVRSLEHAYDDLNFLSKYASESDDLETDSASERLSMARGHLDELLRAVDDVGRDLMFLE